MLSQLVGSVDFNSAAVLIAIAIALCITVTTAIGKRKSRRELTMQFEIDKQKLRNEDAQNERNTRANHESKLAEIASSRDVNFKRIDQGLVEGTKVVG